MLLRTSYHPSERRVSAVRALKAQVRVELWREVHANNTGILRFLRVDVDVRSLESLARGFCVAFEDNAFCLFEVGKTLIIPARL